MEKLIIDKSILNSGHLLCVTLDKKAGIFKIYGYMLENEQDANNHFAIITKWINKYIMKPNVKTDFYFQFNYINTFGMKEVYNLIEKIRNIPNLNIYLVHDPDDEDAEELASEISNYLNVNFVSKKVSLEYQELFFTNPYYI